MAVDFTPQPHDLEQITLCLTLGCIALTDKPGDEFSFDELLAAARVASCGAFEVEERDVRIIGIDWLCRKVPGGKYVMR